MGADIRALARRVVEEREEFALPEVHSFSAGHWAVTKDSSVVTQLMFARLVPLRARPDVCGRSEAPRHGCAPILRMLSAGPRERGTPNGRP